MKKNNNETIKLNKKDFSFLCPMQIENMTAPKENSPLVEQLKGKVARPKRTK